MLAFQQRLVLAVTGCRFGSGWYQMCIYCDNVLSCDGFGPRVYLPVCFLVVTGDIDTSDS